MYNNNFMLDKLARQKKEIDNLMRNYQTPMNIFNVGGSQSDFEARIISENEKPNEIIVQKKTAFICFENALLTIKEINGDIKEYEIIIPKTPEQKENEELKAKIKELEKQKYKQISDSLFEMFMIEHNNIGAMFRRN